MYNQQPYEKRMSKNHPKIIQKLSTHTEIIQKSSNSIQKIYNNCAKNCNNLLIEALQVLAQLLYIFCMEVDDFWMISVCVDNFWMIFGHSFFIGLAMSQINIDMFGAWSVWMLDVLNLAMFQT